MLKVDGRRGRQLAWTGNRDHSVAVLTDLSKEPCYGHAEGVASAEGIKPSADSVVCPLLLECEEGVGKEGTAGRASRKKCSAQGKPHWWRKSRSNPNYAFLCWVNKNMTLSIYKMRIAKSRHLSCHPDLTLGSTFSFLRTFADTIPSVWNTKLSVFHLLTFIHPWGPKLKGHFLRVAFHDYPR